MNNLGFDIEGYGEKIRTLSQCVEDWTSERVRLEFAKHVYTFLLGNIGSIKVLGKQWTLPTAEGIRVRSIF